MVIMRKPIQILVSSLIVLCSCNLNVRNTELSSSDHRISECTMDSSINDIRLMTPISLDSIFLLHVDKYIVNDFQYGEGIYVSNTSNTEFVFFKFNNGRIGQELDAFILTDSIPLEFSPRKIQSRFQKFISTYGAYIGMSKTDFVSRYFNNNESKTEFGSIYAQYDSINLLYNKYYFRNDTLKKIEIGYDW